MPPLAPQCQRTEAACYHLINRGHNREVFFAIERNPTVISRMCHVHCCKMCLHQAVSRSQNLAGRTIRCRVCGNRLRVPRPELIEDEEPLTVLPADTSAEEEMREAVTEVVPPPRPIVRSVRKLPLSARPVRRRRRSTPVFEQGWFGGSNVGVIGGLLMIVIAIVWFVVGLAVGYIFFYPPVLLVIGIIAVVKGLAGRS